MSFDTTILGQKIVALGTATKVAIDAAKALADNSQKLEGLTLAQVIEATAGSVGITIQELRDQIEAVEGDLEGLTLDKEAVGLGLLNNWATATNEETVAGTADRYVSAAGLQHWWSTIVGAAPEELDTIYELANAYSDASDLIDALTTMVGNKVNTTTFNTKVEELESDIEDLQDALQNLTFTAEAIGLGLVDNFATATPAQTVEGTANNLFVTPAGVKAANDEVRADVVDMISALADSFDAAIAALSDD